MELNFHKLFRQYIDCVSLVTAKNEDIIYLVPYSYQGNYTNEVRISDKSAEV